MGHGTGKNEKELEQLGSNLIDNVVLVDRSSTAISFLSTPLWMFTGKRQSVKFIPEAGVSQQDVEETNRFGKKIASVLNTEPLPISQSLFKGMSAVKVEERYIASEKIGSRSFYIWGNLLKKLGNQYSWKRKAGLIVYLIFLVLMIVTVVPLNALLKKILSPLFRKRIEKQLKYYAAPSGE